MGRPTAIALQENADPAERYSSVFKPSLVPGSCVRAEDERGPDISGTAEPRAEQSISARISNLVVQLLHTYTGRGPTKAWTSLDEDLVTVVLRDTLTKGEQSLVSNDRAELVLETRQAFQQTMRQDLITGVERLTGRKVIAFMSANHIDPDMAIESFVLEDRATAAHDGATAV